MRTIFSGSRHPLNSEPSEYVCNVRADHLTGRTQVQGAAREENCARVARIRRNTYGRTCAGAVNLSVYWRRVPSVGRSRDPRRGRPGRTFEWRLGHHGANRRTTSNGGGYLEPFVCAPGGERSVQDRDSKPSFSESA